MTHAGRQEFLTTEMTPRAWRMIAYSCVGICIYGLTVLMEAAQSTQLNRIDRQLQQISRLEVSGAEESASAAPVQASSSSTLRPPSEPVAP